MKELTSRDDLKQAMAESSDQPIFIFKHSTACPISARAAQRVNAYTDDDPGGKAAIYWVKVIESRQVSNAVAEAVGVRHASPQMLLIDKGKAVWNASHGAITAENMDAAIEAALKGTSDS